MSESGWWLISVIVDPRVARLDKELEYQSRQPVEVGQAVIVSVGKKEGLAIVTACHPRDPEDTLLRKAILSRIRGISIPVAVIELVRTISQEYLCPLSVAMGAALPSGMRSRLHVVWRTTTAPPVKRGKKNELQLTADSELKLPPLQAQVLEVLNQKGGELDEKEVENLLPGTQRALLGLQAAGLAVRELMYKPPSESTKTRSWTLNPSAALIEAFLTDEAASKPAQALALISLQKADDAGLRTGFTSNEIRALAGVTDATIRALASQKLLVEVKAAEKVSQVVPPTPNEHQAAAIETVVKAIKARQAQSYLLFGITGSGKTEVYLRCASEVLKQGRQVLYLVPEIALAAQAIGRLRDRFGNRVSVLHSDLSPTERLASFQRIKDGQSPIVLGARSGLFAPLDNIGLIVVDEEHEGAYKQDVEPRYHAKRVAERLAELHNCPLILGSATPAIETYFEAESGKIELLTLPLRAAEAQLPKVEIVDLAEGYRLHHPRMISPALESGLTEILAKGEQAILFLNRRAYTPFLVCRECGKKWFCPRCSVTLSYHKREGQIRCHHCGHTEPEPTECPDCSGTRIAPIGVGTEKVEEAILELFPDTTIDRLDRDITERKGALESVLARFRSGQTQILVGTQIVAKGLDFPGVTLVGVIAADVSINLPDFRSSENAFQLLSQVSGRAGRGQKPGRVVIQTFQPNHPSVVAAQSHDYVQFYALLKSERAAAMYPPFVRIVNVVCSGEDRDKVLAKADGFARLLEPIGEVLGPADCAIERIRDRWRRHVFVKLSDPDAIAKIKEIVPIYPDKDVQVVFDVDPHSMM